MSADFTAVITNGLASIRSMGKAAADSVGRLAGGMDAAGEAAKRTTKTFRDLGTAVARIGGPAGEIGGKLFGAAGMEGGLSRIAAAAVVLGVSLKALGAVMDAYKARASAFADAMASIRQATRSAQEASRGFAIGAEQTGRTQARAENLFGADAGGRANMLANAAGIQTGDVLDAMAGSGAIPSAQRGRLLEAAIAAAATGEGSAADFMSAMSDPGMRARVLGQKAGGGLSAAQRGAALLIMTRRGGRGPEAMREALDTIGSTGPARSQLRGVNDAINLTTEGQRGAFESGATSMAMREARAQALSPTAAALSEWYKNLLESQKKLADLSRETPRVIKVLQILGNPNGSADVQAAREMTAAGKAVLSMQGNSP